MRCLRDFVFESYKQHKTEIYRKTGLFSFSNAHNSERYYFAGNYLFSQSRIEKQISLRESLFKFVCEK